MLAKLIAKSDCFLNFIQSFDKAEKVSLLFVFALSVSGINGRYTAQVKPNYVICCQTLVIRLQIKSQGLVYTQTTIRTMTDQKIGEEEVCLCVIQNCEIY
jgi:hypothetical protein